MVSSEEVGRVRASLVPKGDAVLELGAKRQHFISVSDVEIVLFKLYLRCWLPRVALLEGLGVAGFSGAFRFAFAHVVHCRLGDVPSCLLKLDPFLSVQHWRRLDQQLEHFHDLTRVFEN